jgi:hypothetical protein
MSIRLDPRRLGALKHLAGEAGMRPGDLVRSWVEERIDAERIGPGGRSLEQRVAELEARLSALDGSGQPADRPEPSAERAVAPEPEAPPSAANEPEASETEQPEPEQPEAATPAAADEDGAEPEQAASPETRSRRGRVSAAPSERVALHDEMIALIRERGPMTAGELAAAITERGRYAPPRSGKPLDAAMVSQRVSNPTYRSRFVRDQGRIGLAE